MKIRQLQRLPHRLINYTETKAKCRHKKLPIPLTHCIRVCCILIYAGNWGKKELTGEKLREATVHKARSTIATWLTVSPVYKLWQTPAAKSLSRSNFLDDDILLWCLCSLLVPPGITVFVFVLEIRLTYFDERISTQQILNADSFWCQYFLRIAQGIAWQYTVHDQGPGESTTQGPFRPSGGGEGAGPGEGALYSLV